MKRKLTIRRVGSYIPTIILVGFLFLCITVSWLTFVGLPDSLLRKVERIAAQRGIHLQVGAVRMTPYCGLGFIAENIRINARPEDKEALVTAESAAVEINAFRLVFRGDFCLSSAELKKAAFNLPVTDTPGEYLNGTNIQVTADFTPTGNVHLSSATLNLEGIAVRLTGDVQLPKEEKTEQADATVAQQEATAPIDVPAELAKISSYTDRVFHIINNQQWTQENAPDIRIHLKAQPSFAVALKAILPKYDYDIFQFRNARADIEYQNDVVYVNTLSFDTINPDSTATLRGACELKHRNAEFQLDSNAALLAMANTMLGEDSIPLLEKLHHAPDTPPHIKLKGSIGLEPDYSLRTLTLNGELNQDELFINQTCVDRLSLNFYYKDGNFTINHIRADFGQSSINISATANNGLGKATLTANVEVEKALQLVNEFLAAPLTLPENIKIGEKAQLHATANLTTPNFAPGQSNWQDFTPSIQNLDVNIGFDALAFEDIAIKSPSLHLALNEISHSAEMIPQATEKAQLSLGAAEITKGDIRIEKALLNIEADQVSYIWDKLSVGKLSIGANNQHLTEYIITPWAEVVGTAIHAEMKELSYADETLSIAEASLKVKADYIEQDDLKIAEFVVDIPLLQNIEPLDKDWTDTFSSALINAATTDIVYKEDRLGNVRLALQLAEGQRGKASLTHTIPSLALPPAPVANTLETDIDWTSPQEVQLNNIILNVAPASFTSLLEHFDIKIDAIKLPETLQFKGNLALNADTLNLTGGEFDLSIPKLIRTPQKIKVFQGDEVPIGVDAHVTLTPEAGNELHFRSELKVTHNKDIFDGVVDGTTAGRFNVTGNNTIRADVVDRLIDSETAHSIIRDFRFGTEGRNIITDIDVKVDLNDGLSVDSYCRTELINTDYQLSVILDDDNGKEKLRSDIGENPYTRAKRATCYVRARVRYPDNSDGGKRKDECVITIGDINMLFDNRPWFERMPKANALLSTSALSKARSAHTNTTMTGDAVIIDVENSFVELVNIKGNVYPAYSLGMYYAPLFHFLDTIVLPYPCHVETKSCVFPIYSDCKRPMSGLIKVQSPKKTGFRFLGTTIPMDNFSGFIKLTDDDVTLDKMNAACWGGALDASVKIGISGKRTSFDGYVNAANMDLSKILASYNTTYSSALCNGYLRFRTPSVNIKDLQGYGEATVTNGDLMGFTLFQPISDLVSDLPNKLNLLESASKKKHNGPISAVFSGTGKAITSISNQAKRIPGYNHLFAYDLQKVDAKFAISDGLLRAYDMTAAGYNLDVKMNVDVDLDTTELDGKLWPRMSSLPTLLLSPVTFLSDFMIDINVYGKIDKLKWKVGLDKRLQSDAPSFSSKPSSNNFKPRGETKKAER